MELNQIFSFVSGKPQDVISGSFSNNHIVSTDTDLNSISVAILGLPDNDSGNSFLSATETRNQLYKLTELSKKISILDLGNIIPGNTFVETTENLGKVISFFFQNEIRLFLIGNSTVYHRCIAESFLKNQVSLNQIWIDSIITWDHFVIDPLSINFKETLQNAPVNFINIAYQSYFVEKEILDFINDTNFEAYRLGMVRNKIPDFEPVIRDANLLEISLNAVKVSDAPGARIASPNGLAGEEICQLAFYAGYSNRLKILGIFDILTELDMRCATSMLAAQILWYTLEGFAIKVFEDPELTPDLFSKYHIHIDMTDQTLSFYRSNLTQRWWMEIDLPQKNRSVILSCSEKDYELACKQEIPDRWWRLFKRL